MTCQYTRRDSLKFMGMIAVSGLSEVACAAGAVWLGIRRMHYQLQVRYSETPHDHLAKLEAAARLVRKRLFDI